MVWHLVLMKPRADLSRSDGRKLVEAFQQAIQDVPTIREVRVARRVRHGAGYETRAVDAADFLVSLGFDDLEGLQDYLKHPAHEEVAARFNRSLNSALIYDFESVALADLR
jgi:hypothetical protein